MSDVMAVIGVLLLFGISYPGLLTTWRMLFPSLVERACTRLSGSPWKCFGLGLLVTIGFALPSMLLIALPFGPAKLIGWVVLAAGLMTATLGASGLASLIGERLGQLSGPGLSEATVYVRGALALELAAAFPIVGWFIFLPLSTLTASGAAGFALLNWMPRESEVAQETRSRTATSVIPG